MHDKLGRIEVMLNREMDAPEFDREIVKAEILAISDPDKSEILRRQQEAVVWAKEKAEREARKEAEKAKAAAAAERTVLFIKKFETMYKPKHWPYIGYGHQVQPG